MHCYLISTTENFVIQQPVSSSRALIPGMCISYFTSCRNGNCFLFLETRKHGNLCFSLTSYTACNKSHLNHCIRIGYRRDLLDDVLVEWVSGSPSLPNEWGVVDRLSERVGSLSTEWGVTCYLGWPSGASGWLSSFAES
jgi:hypothetical protein